MTKSRYPLIDEWFTIEEKELLIAHCKYIQGKNYYFDFYYPQKREVWRNFPFNLDTHKLDVINEDTLLPELKKRLLIEGIKYKEMSFDYRSEKRTI